MIDPSTYRVIDEYQTGLNPQHVVPAYDLRTLYVTNDLSNSLTPIDPAQAGPPVRTCPWTIPTTCTSPRTDATRSW